MWKNLCIVFLILLSIIFNKVDGQTLTYTFLDPCTNQTSYFSVPSGGTTIMFLNQSAVFTSNDVANGVFANWINNVYTTYRTTNPCPKQVIVQNNQVTQNQITTQIISSTVQSIVSDVFNSIQNTLIVDNSNDSKGKIKKDKKNTDKSTPNTNNTTTPNNGSVNTNGTNTNNNSTNTNNSGSNNGSTTNTTNNNTNNSGSNNGSTTPNSNGTNNSGSNNGGSNPNSTNNVGSSTTPNSGDNKPPTTNNGDNLNVIMNVDAHEENGSSGGGKGKSNPIIVSSDITSAQNLNKSFTGIINIGMSKSSLTGRSSKSLTSMTWFNLREFALSGKYTKIHLSKNGKLKWVNNINLTGVYTYGNVLAFLGYSSIINAKKFGIAGFNITFASTIIAQDKSTFLSPSITAFYTKPFKANKRLTISPEIYIISTPVIYSTKDKITQTDRYFSGFIGSGFDYAITKRFKVNLNYKANLSTNPTYPVLSFFLIGSKVNL
jgi:hypothetical protein